MAKSIHFLRPDITTSQDLSAAPLSFTTSIARKFKLEKIIFHFSQAITETITITHDSKQGVNYDNVLRVKSLVAETDFVFIPELEGGDYLDGDEIKIECTDANGLGIVYPTIKTSEM